MTTRRLYFYGSGGTLFGIHVVNVLLTLVTLGVYYFWGKVRVRRYLLSETELEQERFAYHGTGGELLVGWLKALLVFGVPSFLLFTGPEMAGLRPEIQVALAVTGYAIILMFVPVAVVGARRYRLARTSWRGIRFSFRGRALEFVRLFLGRWLLTLITLGLYYPIYATRRYAFLTTHSYFGDRRFGFDGQGRALLGSYLLTLVLLLPTLGLCTFWFRARLQRYLWDHTRFGEARFHSTVTGGRLLGLTVVNLLLLLLTLGLAWPWAVARSARFAVRYLTLEGDVDLDAILQEAQTVSLTGEGLAGFFDSGFDLG